MRGRLYVYGWWDLCFGSFALGYELARGDVLWIALAALLVGIGGALVARGKD